MSLIVDGISPTEINIDGNSDINVLEVDGVYYWGKPFTLSSAPYGDVSVVVERTSSPYEHAENKELLNRDMVYYGDTLSITATAGTDSYLSSLTKNGETTTFALHSVQNSKTSVTITNQTSANIYYRGVTPVWNDVWSGSFYNYASFSNSTTTKDLAVFGFVGKFNDSSRVRITGSGYRSGETFQVVISGTLSSVVGKSTRIVDDNYYQYIKVKDSKTIQVECHSNRNDFVARGIRITKIEAFY